MKCMSCTMSPNIYKFKSELIEWEVEIYECPFGNHTFHLYDHRCSHFKHRKRAEEAMELNQNEEVKHD